MELQISVGKSEEWAPRDRPGVLVVDDDLFVGNLVRLGLQQNGFDVLLARNGLEAINLYRECGQKIAIVLLDVVMPGLDGVETLEAVRELNPDVLACFMTGNPGAYEAGELLERGATCVIPKPFHLDQVVEMLRLLADGMPANKKPSVFS